MVNTKVTLSGWELDNPVIPASGTFGYGKEFSEIYDINVLGTFSFKGTTVEPRFGNPTPRIAESDTGIVNSIGLQNPGMEHVLAHELPEMKKFFHKKVIANVSGFSVEEYVRLCERFGKEEQVGILEVNVSCPNVKAGGLALGTSCENVYAVAKAVKEVTDKPIYMKLSPNVTDIATIAKACEEGGADGHAHRSENEKADYRAEDRGIFGQSVVPRRTQDGVSGVRSGEYPYHRNRGRIFRGRRDRDDAGGRERRRRGRGESDRSVRKQKNRGRSARGDGKIRHRKFKRYYRSGAQWLKT